MRQRTVSEDPEVIIRASVITDPAILGPRLRECDLAEVAALTDKTPDMALLECIVESHGSCFTVTVRGIPAIMGGVAPHPSDAGVGVPWLLASPDMYTIVPLFLEHQHALFDEVAEGYTSFVNVTSNFNPIGQRWLKSMGFILGEVLTGAGRNGEDLQVFRKEC